MIAAGNQVPQRVLVVDDVDEVRSLIRRVLSAGGYEVDVATSLTEAREMDPGQYDAVLVDAHLGRELGLDLVQELRLGDRAAAGRCLVMTGGAIGSLPKGVAFLLKPFQPGELLDAVRALHQPDTAKAVDQRVRAVPEAGQPSPASGSAGTRPATGGHPASRLLAITRRLRTRERDEMVDFLHDGPLQDLTAAILGLHMMRRSAGPAAAQALDATLGQLDAAAGSLRWLVDGNWPFMQPEDGLAVSLQQRTAWLLGTPVTVDTDVQRAELDVFDVPAVVDIVELMLLVMVNAGLRAQAHVAVRIEAHPIQIEVNLTAAEADVELIGDPETAQASLDELASALQAGARIEPGGREWRIRIALPAGSRGAG
jgi:CheY-like chemotaxis protein